MRFSIFTHAEHKLHHAKLYSYRPYVREINLWNSNFDETCVLSPSSKEEPGSIDSPYIHKNVVFKSVSNLHFKNKELFLTSVFYSLKILLKIFGEMRKADHIHIRCPGNIGLLACFVQILFPHKRKTVKYAGNWDPESKQPLSYRFQKWLLANTFLTRNTKVLVYGEWKKQSKNILPFFTATYSKKDIDVINKDFKSPYKFVFAGSLVEGKRPFLAVKIISELIKKGFNVYMDVYGDGKCKLDLIEYIHVNGLSDRIVLHGNQSSAVLKEAYKNSHFSILPSKSEGWPKAIAEAMFFGCVPIATKISCVAWMFDKESRGILIDPELKPAVEKISRFLKDPDGLGRMSQKAKNWSEEYTLEKFEYEIKKLL